MGITAVGAYFNSDRTNQQANDGNGGKAGAYGCGLKYNANNVYPAAFYGESRNTTQYGNNGTNADDVPFNFSAKKPRRSK